MNLSLLQYSNKSLASIFISMSSSLGLLGTPGVEDSIDEGDELVEESKFVKTQVDIVASGSVVEVSSVKS